MADPVIRVLRLPGADPAVPLPAYQTAGAAGADLCASFPDRAGVTLAPGARALIPTGLAFDIPEGFEIQVRARSGLALKQGLALVNGIGTIDADYRGEVGVIVVNLGAEPIEISHGMRIAQLVLAPVIRARFEPAEALSDSARGTGGFGHTGTA